MVLVLVFGVLFSLFLTSQHRLDLTKRFALCLGHNEEDKDRAKD